MANETFNDALPAAGSPVTEADLHAYVDQQLVPARRVEVQSYLLQHPQHAGRVRQWQLDAEGLRTLLNPVLSEPVPQRLLRINAPSLAGALAPAQTRSKPWMGWGQAAACGVLEVLAAGGGWYARDWVGDQTTRAAAPTAPAAPAALTPLAGFAQRAAVAHAVYSPEVRRPVEVGADQEQQLVTWLSKRMGTIIKAPALAPLGYQLVGGRLLPGEASAVAQFMYQDRAGQRLTLYVTREVPAAAGQPGTAFQFGQVGPTQVFYWVDQGFGYALSGAVDRQALLQVSQEVYRQLAPR